MMKNEPYTLGSLLKEPLLHFVILGGLLFAVSLWRGDVADETAGGLHVSSADMERLSALWTRQWNRAPSAQEQSALMSDHVKEVLLAREAVALELDQDDIIVQRRLAQKMKFLLEDTVRINEPGDAVLRDFYLRHPQLFQMNAQVSLSQYFFTGQEAAAQGLQTLRSDSEVEVGEPSLLEKDVYLVDQQILANLFGEFFSVSVFAMPVGQWQGPVESGYGFHLVRVNERRDVLTRPFEAVRELVVAEWMRVEQAKAEQLYFHALLKKYDVSMDESLRNILGTTWLSQGAN